MRWHLYIIGLILGGLLPRVACAQIVPNQPPPQVQITPQEGGYLVTTPDYKARIYADGNLHSLIVNGVEMLDDRVAGSAGSAFFVEHPIALPTMTVQERIITASDGTYSVRYDFDEGFITVVLRQTSTKSAAYVTFCTANMAFVENISSATVLPYMAAVPADHDWSDVVVETSGGEYLKLYHGSRIWGRELGRQVWELSNITPNKDYSLLFVPGVHEPRQPSLNQLTNMSASFSTPDHLVLAGSPAELNVSFENNSDQAVSSEMNIRVESSLKVPLLQEHKPFTCAPHNSIQLKWTLTPQLPDFYTVTCAVKLSGAVKSLVTTFGYATSAIAPLTAKPADFNAYWDKVVADAKAAEPKLVRLDSRYSTGTVNVYRIRMEADGTTCFGWLAVPKFPGRYPGILFLPGEHMSYISPNTPNIPLAACGFVVLSIEPTGQSVEGPVIPLIKQMYTHPNDPATFGLRAIIMRYLRAITALSEIPEVDSHRLGVAGISLGGGLSMLLAALDERVWAAAPDVPYYCDIESGQSLPGWPYPEVREYLAQHQDQQEAVMQTLRYYDVANFADRLTCPVLISAGIDDRYSQPAGIFAVNNRLAGPHTLKLYLADHKGGDVAHWKEKIKWLKQVLGSPSPQPTSAAAERGKHDGTPTP